MKVTRKGVLTCLWACVATALFPVAFLYFTNVAEASFRDSAGALVFSLAVMAVLYALALAVTRNMWKACLVSGLFFLLIANYWIVEKVARKLIPLSRYWHIVPVAIVVLLHIAYFLCKKMSPDFFETAALILGLVFSALILINVVTAVPTMIQKAQIHAQQAQLADRPDGESGAADPAKAGAYPNIYYLLFDEYSNFPVLEKYYQYDNKDLRDFLEENRFTISLDSQNEMPSTVVVTTNNLNLDYVVSSSYNYEEYRKDPPLFKLLDSYGYDISYLSPEQAIQWKETESTNKMATTVDGLTVWDIFFQKTIFSPFFNRDDANEYQAKFYEQFDFVDQCIKAKDNNNFVYVHFSFPHLPFIFDEDGNYIGMENRNNTQDNQYYLGQLKYTTAYMMDEVEKILEKDPDSIIILQSDHSNRYIGKPLGQGSLGSETEATNIFNAVYYRGEDIPEICGQSSVNTLRAVLNRALGENFEMLEVPFYG